jgi:hypothetical protein
MAPFGLIRMTRLERYVAGCVLRAVLLSAAAIVALFSLLAFVDQLGAVGQGRYNIGDVLIYTLLTIPARVMQMAPVAMLLGGLLGFGLLSRQSELVIMQSLGLSAARIVDKTRRPDRHHPVYERAIPGAPGAGMGGIAAGRRRIDGRTRCRAARLLGAERQEFSLRAAHSARPS